MVRGAAESRHGVPISFTVRKGEAKLTGKERSRSWKSLWLIAFLILFILVGGGLFVLSRRSPRHERLYVKGVLHARGGNNKKAVEAFRQAIKLAPDHNKARRALVETLISARQFEEAEEALDTAVAQDQLRNQEAILRARLMSYRAAFRLDAAGPALDAELCEKVLQEDLRPAIETLKAHLEQASEPAEAQKLLGDIWRQVRAVLVQDRALLYAKAEEAVALEKPAEATSLRAEAAATYDAEQEAIEQAEHAYRSAIENAPEGASPRLALAQILLETAPDGRAEAEALLQKIVHQRPDHRQARLLLARLASEAGNSEEALRHVAAVEGDRPRSPEVLQLKTAALLNAGRLEEADETSEELVRTSTDVNSLLLRGKVLVEKRDYEGAIPLLQRTAATLVRGVEQARGGGRPGETTRALAQVFAVQTILAGAEEMAGMSERAAVSFEDALATGQRHARELQRAIAFRGDAIAGWWNVSGALGAGVPQAETERWRVARICRQLGDLYTELARSLNERRRISDWVRRLASAQTDETGAARPGGEIAALRRQAVEATRGAARAYTLVLLLAPETTQARVALAGRLVDLGPAFARSVPAVLKPVLDARADDAEALAMAVRAAVAVGDHERVLDLWDRLPPAAQSGPEMTLLRATALAETGQWDAVDSIAEEMIAQDPDAPLGDFLRGRVLVEKGQSSRAPEYLRKALEKARGTWPEAHFYLARALLAQGERDEGVSELRKVLESPPEQLPKGGRTWRDAHLLLARELRNESPGEALDHARQALMARQLAPDILELVKDIHARAGSEPQTIERDLVAYAFVLVIRRDLAGALDVCRTGRRELGEGATRLRLLEARLLAQKGMYREAVEAFGELTDAFPGRQALLELAGLHVRLQHWEAAEEAYLRVLQAAPDNRTALHALVGLYSRTGDFEKARETLLRLDPDLASGEVRTALMDLYARERKLDEAVNLARQQAREQPDSVLAHALLVHFLWQRGDLDGVRETCRKIRELDDAAAVGYLEGLAELASGRAGAALQVYERAPVRLQSRPRLATERAVALFCDNRDERAVSLLRSYDLRTARSAWTTTGWWFLALMRAAGGDPDGAVALSNALSIPNVGLRADRQAFLQRIAEMNEERSREAAERAMLMTTFRLANGARASLDQVERLSELLPDEPLVRCWRLSLVSALGRREEALAGYEDLIEERPDFVFARMSLARSYAADEDYGSALRVVEGGLATAEPAQQAQLRLVAGSYAERVGRVDDAIAHYRAATEHDATAAAACNNLAYALATAKQDVEAALPLAERAAELAGGEPAILDTLGWVYYLAGRGGEAVRYLEAARQGMPRSAEVRYHLGLAYLAAGLREEGRRELEEALALSDTFAGAAEARQALAALGAGNVAD